MPLHRVQRIAGPSPAEALGIEHRQRQRLLFVGAETLGFGPDDAFLAQQLTDLGARLTGDDGQVQVLALQ
ncbi:hypothetical protein D3C71_2142470 [compost metagenome]